MDILDQALGGEALSEHVDAPALETNDPAGGPARAADGKFVSAAPAAAPVQEPAPVAAEAPKPEPGHVPISALMDERDKRKSAEDRLRALEGQRQPAAEQPDIDPDTANLVLQTRLNLSEEMAKDKYGDDVVEAAKQAVIQCFAQNPSFQQEVLSKANPYRFVVEWHKEQERLEAVKDPTQWEQFQAWKAGGGQAPNPTPAQPAAALVAAAPPTPPRSIASAPNAGGNVNTAPVGPGVAFDNVIK